MVFHTFVFIIKRGQALDFEPLIIIVKINVYFLIYGRHLKFDLKYILVKM